MIGIAVFIGIFFGYLGILALLLSFWVVRFLITAAIAFVNDDLMKNTWKGYIKYFYLFEFIEDKFFIPVGYCLCFGWIQFSNHGQESSILKYEDYKLVWKENYGEEEFYNWQMAKTLVLGCVSAILLCIIFAFPMQSLSLILMVGTYFGSIFYLRHKKRQEKLNKEK